MTSRYTSVSIDAEHPLAVGRKPRQDGRVVTTVHRVVLFDAIGPGDHPCHWCSTMVSWRRGGGLTVDHLNNIGVDNRRENLVPSCHGCNCSRPSGDAPSAPNSGTGRRREANGRHKLTTAEVAEIRSRFTGRRREQAALAREFGVQRKQVGRIVHGQQWIEEAA